VSAPFFSGVFYGNGAGLTGVSASNVSAGNILPGTLGAGVLLPPGNLLAGPLTATSGTFTAAGASQFSIQTSSGVNVVAGGVSAPFFSGAFYGSGAGLTGVSASNVFAANVLPGTLGAGVLLPTANLVGGPVPSSMLPYWISAGSASFSAGISAASGTFTAAGSSQYSIATSSGVSVGGGGGVTAAFFNGAFYGNGAGLTGVSATSVGAGSVTPGTFQPGVQLPAGQITPGPITATSGTFTAGGTNQYSITTSSGINAGGPVVAPAFVGSGAGLTGVSVTGTPPIGSLIAFAGQTEPYGWVECDGRSLPQTGNAAASWGQFNSAAVFAVLGTVWGSVGAGYYNIPDMRGVFPRGWNHGKSTGFYDPDAASRVAQYTSGVTGDKIGTYQADLVRGHYHVEGSFGSGPLSGGSGGYYPYPQNPNTGNVVDQPATGNMESRPKNASVMYLMRIL
jgi:hypothetical protein